LEKAGYQLLTAGTAEQGLAMIQNDKPALIILDVILPAIDGLAALRKLKADEQTKTIPVIIITAATSQEHYATLREAMTCGAAAFLTKPFGPDKLVSEIKRLLSVPARWRTKTAPVAPTRIPLINQRAGAILAADRARTTASVSRSSFPF